MNKDFIKIFEETQALMHGHFILSSGLHSPMYVQCAKLLSYRSLASKICVSLISANINEHKCSGKKYRPLASSALGNVSLGA